MRAPSQTERPGEAPHGQRAHKECPHISPSCHRLQLQEKPLPARPAEFYPTQVLHMVTWLCGGWDRAPMQPQIMNQCPWGTEVQRGRGHAPDTYSLVRVVCMSTWTGRHQKYLFPIFKFSVEKLNQNRVRGLPKFTQQVDGTPPSLPAVEKARSEILIWESVGNAASPASFARKQRPGGNREEKQETPSRR